MSIVQIVLLGVVGAAASIILKKSSPELAMITGIATGIIILYFAVNMLFEIITSFTTAATAFNINSEYIELIIRIIGITYLSEFIISSLKDAGESGIAAKIEMFAKILIVSMSLPVFNALISVVSTIMI